MDSNSEHWNSIYSNTEDSKLGWYEKDAAQTFTLLNQIPGWKGSTIFIPGAGTSILIERLSGSGPTLVLNDISDRAIHELQARLPKEDPKIHWLCQDISQPVQAAIPEIDIWIDRAVLHFLKEEKDIQGYFNNLAAMLKPGGHVLFAEFSMAGERICAGLELHRYSVEELSERLGSSYRLLSHFDHIYINPEGAARPYLYALYRRTR